MSTYRRPVTAEQKAKADADRERKLRDLHERLEQQVRALRTGEDWQRWLSFAARFHDYSFQNTLLILAQRPDATAVAGYDAWRRMGRQVGKGEKGIAVLAPIIRRGKRDETPDDEKSETQARVVAYRPVHVWDVAQTGGAPLPKRPDPQLLSGAAPDGLWDSLAGLVADAGYSLERGDCGQANGITSPHAKVVRVSDQLDDAQAVKTLAHELGHVSLHCGDDAEVALRCRGAMEVEAESVAYLVMSAHGLDSGSYTFPYVAHWASDIPGVTPEEAVRQTGQRVMTATRQVLSETLSQVEDPRAQQLAERTQAGTRATADLRQRAEIARSRAEIVARPARRDREVTRADLVELHVTAARFYQAQMRNSWVPDYLATRGLDVALGEPWCAGWAPSGWTTLVDHLRREGADDEALLASGLTSSARTGSLIDRFRDRLMLPLRQDGGEVVGFLGRAHPDADPARVAKYLNSPQTPTYKKRELLFGLAETRTRLSRGALPVLVEGPLDAIAVTAGTGGRCAGLAACGAVLTATHVEHLAKVIDLRTRNIVVATDADYAGQAAAEMTLDVLTPYGMSPRRAGLPPGMDPADVFARGGEADLTAALLDRTRPLADVVIDARLQSRKTPYRWIEERVGALRDLAPLVASLPLDDVRRQVDRLSQRLDLDVSTVQREISLHIGVPRRQTSSPRSAAPRAPAAIRSPRPTSASPRRAHR